MCVKECPLLCIYSVPANSAINCGDPGTPTNGQRSLSSTTYNSVVTYTCDVGYTLQGSNSRTCQSSGQWSGSVPQCIGMLVNGLQAKYWLRNWQYFSFKCGICSIYVIAIWSVSGLLPEHEGKCDKPDTLQIAMIWMACILVTWQILELLGWKYACVSFTVWHGRA